MVSSNTKYIFVTGGVLSGVGKGITAASIGAILKARGLKVNIQKCDPYFNVDSGTLNPAEHGEVFVTADGAETDLDLGHYERFLDAELSQRSSTMSGRIYRQVIDDERAGKYLGKTVQIIPHVTNAMQDAIVSAGRGFDVHIVEIGGTVGDYESTAFIEAVRQLKVKVGPGHTLYVHVVYLPFLESSQELKSKPAQNAVRDLREAGIHPDIIVARAEQEVPQSLIDKLSVFTDVKKEAVIPMKTVKSVYQVPILLEELGVGDLITRSFRLTKTKPDLSAWQKLVKSILDETAGHVTVAVVAKYLDHQDTYSSVVEALKAAAWSRNRLLNLVWLDAEKITEENVSTLLDGVNGVVVPGGFGQRGVEGKIAAAKYALQKDLPYLGLCLGMQVAAIAAARISGKTNAHSTEFDPSTPFPVIDLMESQKNIVNMGGTMRLGNFDCRLKKGSKASKLYGSVEITERHRHRYEFNSSYTDDLLEQGLIVSGTNPQSGLAEIVESTKNKFFVASQFHPEFNSRPLRPHPLFVGLIEAAIT